MMAPDGASTRELPAVTAVRHAVVEAGPLGAPGPSWFLDVLTGPPPACVPPRTGRPRAGTTLCTLVADLTAGEAVIAPRGEPPVAIPLADLAEGSPRAQSNFETADRGQG